MTNALNRGVYRWLNTVTGKSYVGSSMNIEQRKKEHLRDLKKGSHHSIKLQRAWNKYGGDVFEFEVIAYCLEGDLLWQEQIAIDGLNAVSYGYNVAANAASPMKGRTHSEETRKKISKVHTGIPKSAQQRELMSLNTEERC